MNSFFVSELFACDYRNLESFSLKAHPRLNILHGGNGQGKTNIIEAICVGLSTKSMRPVKNIGDLIAHGKTEARINIKCSGENPIETSVTLGAKGKKVEIHGKAIRDLSSLLERVAIVSFVPDELQIVSASSSYRRRALNQIAAGLFPNYVSVYRKYEKALFSRNQLLKDTYTNKDQLRSFNIIFAELAAEITRYRDQAISLWFPFFKEGINSISGNHLHFDARYAPSILADPKDAVAQLDAAQKEEALRRTTVFGPHLDDLLFTIDGIEARFLASRGQARAIVLAVKLGQLNAIASIRKTPTVLLLDDVAGELDPEKVSLLLSTVRRLEIQTFFTTTHLDALFECGIDNATFDIYQGNIRTCAT